MYFRFTYYNGKSKFNTYKSKPLKINNFFKINRKKEVY